MPSAKKLAKAEAARQEILALCAANEAHAKSYLTRKDVQYYSLNDVSINYHDTGKYNNEFYEGYVMFPDPVPKDRLASMQTELLNQIRQDRSSLPEVAQYVTTEKSQDYWAMLYWYSSSFISEIKKGGRWSDSTFSWNERRKAVNDLVGFGRKFHLHMARDLVQFVLNERPIEYLRLVFESSKDITSGINLTKDDTHGIKYVEGKVKYKLGKFGDAKKYCW